MSDKQKMMTIFDEGFEAPAPIVNVAASPSFDLHSLAATPIGNFAPEPLQSLEKRKGFLGMLSSKFAMSLACTFIVSAAWKMDAIYYGFRKICSVAKKFEDPEFTGKLGKLVGKGEETIAKAEKEVDAQPDSSESKEHKLTLKGRLADKVTHNPTLEKAGEKIEVVEEKVKDAGEKVKGGAEEVRDTAATVKNAAQTLTNPLAAVGTQIGNTAKAAGNGLASTGRSLGTSIANMPRPTPPPVDNHVVACPYCRYRLRISPSNKKPMNCSNCGARFLPADGRAAARMGRGF